MEAKGRLAVVAAVLSLGMVAAWFAFDRREAAPPIAPAAAATNGPPDADAASLVHAEAAPTAPVADAVVEASAAAPSRSEVPVAGPKLATLRGRCVDGRGTPLAGCKVQLNGWECNSQRMETWLKDHADKPIWKNPDTITTGSDGVFAFTFWPPPPFQFALDVDCNGCAGMGGRWTELAEGATRDVGDIAMSPGVHVVGRVIDDGNVPQEREYVTLRRRGDGRAVFDAIVPRGSSQAVSRPDGAFTMRGWLPPGDYEVTTQKSELQSPERVTLTIERPEVDLVVVVRQRRAEDAISGRVIDETGAPVPRARIDDRSARGWASAASERDGTFEIRRQKTNDSKTASLILVSNEYEVGADGPRQVAWGTKDVEFRVTTAPSLTVRVTDATHAPVGSYLVRLIPRNRNGSSSDDSRARAQGRHDDGTVVIPGLTRGDWLLFVEFPSDLGFDAIAETFTQEAGPRRFDLHARPSQRRALRVVGADGAPIAGSKVQLCDPFGKPLDDTRMVMSPEQWLWNASGPHARVLFEGETDAKGHLELRGPGGRDLGLCVLGPGHLPLRVPAVRLEIADELVVPVSRGARLVGRIVPPEAFAELKRRAGVAPAEPFGDPPQLTFRSDQGVSFPKDHFTANNLSGLRITADGSFAADGLPPGTWEVFVNSMVTFGQGGIGRAFRAGRVDLVDGETTQRDLDLGGLLPGTLRGQVLWNGRPFADSEVNLQNADDYARVTTDAEGRFEQLLAAGEWRLTVSKDRDDRGWSMFACASKARVVRGEVTTQTFALEAGTLHATVLDANGKPAAGVTIQLKNDEDYDSLPPSDDAGAAACELTAGTWRMRALPKQFASHEAQGRLWAEARANGVQDPLASLWIELGTVTVTGAQTIDLPIRLPATAGY